ncbi:MAG: sulfite exporter TauE/SafE family protein [Clostridia bacterium]|nr:sulfite exporter TauE/SafE family protein [Clostridia bacterium]
MNYIVSVVAGFLSGLIGSMGFGGGGILIIYLVIFANTPQIVAQGINLIFFIPCALLATIIYSIKKQIKFKVILPVILGGIIGVLFASYFLSFIKSEWLSKAFAIFLILMGLATVIKVKIKKKSM